MFEPARNRAGRAREAAKTPELLTLTRVQKRYKIPFLERLDDIENSTDRCYLHRFFAAPSSTVFFGPFLTDSPVFPKTDSPAIPQPKPKLTSEATESANQIQKLEVEKEGFMKKTIKMLVLAILGAAMVSGSIAHAGFARAWAGKAPASPTSPTNR